MFYVFISFMDKYKATVKKKKNIYMRREIEIGKKKQINKFETYKWVKIDNDK